MELAAGVGTRTELKAGFPHVLRAWRLDLGWTHTPQAILPPQTDSQAPPSWRKQCGSGSFCNHWSLSAGFSDGFSSRKWLGLVGIASRLQPDPQAGTGAEGGSLCLRSAGRVTNDPGVARPGEFPGTGDHHHHHHRPRRPRHRRCCTQQWQTSHPGLSPKLH